MAPCCSGEASADESLPFEACPSALIDHVNAYLSAVRSSNRARLVEDAAHRDAHEAAAANDVHRSLPTGEMAATASEGAEDFQRKFLGQGWAPWLALYDSVAVTENKKAASGRPRGAGGGAGNGRAGASDSGGVCATPAADEPGEPQGALVIVASLIDKLPNQGGITRTTEAMGASGVVLPDRAALRKSAYTSVCVTAHEHVPMEFVPPDRLRAWLDARRAEGWEVVGLEQTANSVSSWEYRWPSRRTLLVLGHEQRGMPAEIIAACDRCIEIPLFGHIRSLNVHVSASIAIADWARHWKAK